MASLCLKNQLPVWQGLLVLLHYLLSVSVITESTVTVGDLNPLNEVFTSQTSYNYMWLFIIVPS